MKKALLMVILLCAVVTTCAHAASSVEATAKSLKSKAMIGDDIPFIIQVTHPRKVSLEPMPSKFDLAPFELKKLHPPRRQGQNRVTETFAFTLTAFELGDLKVPPVTISFRSESGQLDQVRTEPVPVKIVSVGKKLTDKDDIRSIKGPASSDLARFRTGFFGVVAAALFFGLIFLVVRRRLREMREAESRKPPHERAQIELGRLKEQGLLEERKYKEYYSGLADVLRRYLERGLKIEVFDRTTSELVDEMKTKPIDPTVVEKTKTVLEEADLVKFAKLEPERTLADRLENEIRNVVELTKPVKK